MRLRILVIAFLIVCSSSSSWSGTRIRCSVQALDPSAVPGEVTMYLEPDRARLEFKNDEVWQAVIFMKDGGKPLLWIVDENAWTYRKIDNKVLKKAHGKVMDELEAIEGELRKLPREERDATRANLRHVISRLEDIVHPKKAEKFTYEKAADTKEVRQWTCDSYSAYYEGELEHVYQVASWNDIGLSYDDVKILVEMRENFGDVAMELGFVALWSGNISGFPVRMESYVDGILMDVTALREVTSGDFGSSLYELSTSFEEQPFFESRRDGSGSGLFSLIGGTGAQSASQRVNSARRKPGYK